MCRKLFYLTSFVLLLCLVSNASAQKGKGNILYEWWFDIGAGTAVADLTSNPGYPNSPDEAEWRTSFEGPVNWRDNYGTRARGYVYPPASGDYSFWISGDDFCELWMSTDDDPANITMIAEVPGWTEAFIWDTYTDQKSQPITLAAGQKYYIEALMKEAGGGDSLTVAWGGPGIGTGPIIIEGRYLSPVIRPVDMLPRDPVPADGAVIWDTWVSAEWAPGVSAVSHDVYFGENSADVEAGSGDTFLRNQSETNFLVGFPGFPYPDGLVPGTTYYWRIEEVNDADPESPWVGPVWSFSVAPKTAWAPDPADGAEFVDLNVQLRWTTGFGAKLHYVVFGSDFDEVSNAVMGKPAGITSYNPGPLELAKTYYWRVDEFEGPLTHKGEVWSFTTEGAVSGPNPANRAVDIKPSVILRWDAGAIAASHEVYFGADADAVKNATTASPEYKGPKALGEESYDPGKLILNTMYYWRIDEVNGVNPDSPWEGTVWRFTTGDFFSIDDFEDYDAGDNQIWFSWHDGLGAGAPGTPGYIPGNGTGAAVGDETTASYTEETIVQGGSQSMPLFYDNNKQGFSKYSETELTLTAQRDWTEEGVANLSLWFRGNPASVGSFIEAPVGTYTMTASGADIWAVNGVEADEFHFAYKTLTGTGSMVAKVESVGNTDAWAKAGVMIRETLTPDSAHAMMVVTPGSGASFQRRPGTGQTSLNTDSAGIVAPYWVKINRDMSGNFTGSISANGSTWTTVGTWENIPMSTNVYIGLAVTAHNVGATCEAVFSNVSTTGSVGPQWANQDIGIASNDAEPLYVAVSNSAGTPVVVVHDDPAAATIDTWTEWIIPLQALADQGIVLTNVDRIAVGLGTQGNMTVPGGSGKMLFDNFRLYLPREVAE
ncbi:MAG: PA14 domain-containing protein [Sedimentisphaerales bacterium]